MFSEGGKLEESENSEDLGIYGEDGVKIYVKDIGREDED
jgi:hypothetical protein